MKVRSIINFIKWLLKYRRLGLPIQYYNNASYLDWFINWRPYLIKYKNKHEGEDCFIIGNGPSLKLI